jgi:CBS-domain-containing membrane protein
LCIHENLFQQNAWCGTRTFAVARKDQVRGFLGALLAIGTVAYLTAASGTPLVLGSFGASCVLLFSFPDNPFSQPRNVIGGHFIASLQASCFWPHLDRRGGR